MSASSTIITAVGGTLFLGVFVLAILGVFSTAKAAHATAGPGRKKSGVAVGVPRLAAQPRKRDEVRPLPADATVTFADERGAAGIDEVLEALDKDLVGLVPVK